MMTRTDRFESLDAFLAEKRRLTETRALQVRRIAGHWEALKRKDVRKKLSANAFHDLLGLWKPTRMLASLLGNGSIGTSLGVAFAAGKSSWPRRAALFALGLIAPKLLKRLNDLSIEDIVHELAVSAGHIRDHLRSRKRSGAAEQEANVNEYD